MRDLNYQLKQLCTRNRDGSSGIRAKRQRTHSPRGGANLTLVMLSQALLMLCSYSDTGTVDVLLV